MAWLPDLKWRFLSGKSGVRATTIGNRPTRQRTFELLESRIALSASGLVPVGSQPDGALSGKIVFTSPGHGIEWEGSSYLSDRPDYNEIIEDWGNQDQLTYYADYLLRAGATVVPMRPVGRQLNEVVLDNDSAGVTYSGSWSDSGASRYYDEDYGVVADAVSYRFADTTLGAETAVATYTPEIPAAGFYPVYTWVARGSNRTEQLYRINHTGGATEICVDHTKVGFGWVYLGTYHFDGGSSVSSGSVQISNQADEVGKVVIADAIRFGNGMGDFVEFGAPGASGYPREDESSYYWIARSIGIGTSLASTIGSSNVSAPSNMAQWMYDGDFGDAVYIGFHSNGTTGNPNTATARGALGLMTSSSSLRTPNQQSLATILGRQIDQDFQALDALPIYANLFGPGWSWYTGSNYVGSNANFGEIDLGPSAEMDATIIEVAFHDTLLDSYILREPSGRDQIARSVYQGTVEYFATYGGTANVSLPTAPTDISVVSNARGEVTLNWAAGPTSPTGAYGNAATGYRVYASVDGYGFDGGTYVAGGGTTSATLAGYDPTLPYYFKIVAVNAGGESLASEVVTALPSGGLKQVLIVNGFDRLDRSQNFRYPFYSPAGNFVDRVWSRYNNSFDYVVQVHSAINTAVPGVHVDSTSNEAVASGAIDLAEYSAVIWILGDESTVDQTFSVFEQALVEQFIAGGGDLFLSGAEIGWDLDRSSGPTAADREFYNTTLMADYVADDAGTYKATPAAGGIFAGLDEFSFSNGAEFSSLDGQLYDVDYPDVMTPLGGAQVALNYSNGAGAAAIQATGTGGRGSLVMLGFPFETITTAANRAAVIDRVFDFFALAPPPFPNADFNGDGIVDAADYTVWRDSKGQNVTPGEQGDADYNGQVDEQDYLVWKQQFGTSPGAGGGAGAGDAAVESLAPSAAVTLDEAADEQEPQLSQLPLDATATRETRASGPAIGRTYRRPHDAAFESTDLLFVTRGRSPLAAPQRMADASEELNRAPSEGPADVAGPSPLAAELVKSLRRLG